MPVPITNREILQREIETGYRKGLPPTSNRTGAGNRLSQHQIEKKKQQLQRIQDKLAEREAERSALLSHDVAETEAVKDCRKAHSRFQDARLAAAAAREALREAAREKSRSRRRRSDARADFDAGGGSASALDRAEEEVARLREKVDETRARAREARKEQSAAEKAVSEAREAALEELAEHQVQPVRRLLTALREAREAQAELAELESAFDVATPPARKAAPSMQLASLGKGRVAAWMEEAEDFT